MNRVQYLREFIAISEDLHFGRESPESESLPFEGILSLPLLAEAAWDEARPPSLLDTLFDITRQLSD